MPGFRANRAGLGQDDWIIVMRPSVVLAQVGLTTSLLLNSRYLKGIDRNVKGLRRDPPYGRSAFPQENILVTV